MVLMTAVPCHFDQETKAISQKRSGPVRSPVGFSQQKTTSSGASSRYEAQVEEFRQKSHHVGALKRGEK